MNVVYKKLEHLIPRVVAIKTKENDDMLIVANDNLDIIYLNETSKDFLEMCDGIRDIHGIVDEMLKMYDVAPDVLEQDILSLIRDLQWNNIITLMEVKKV